MERFWNKVNKNSGHFGADGKYPTECHEWTANRRKRGHSYGMFRYNGRMHNAHRIAWMLYKGKYPKGKCILHKCDNPPCVREDHLFKGTQTDNVKDAVSKGRNKGPKSENSRSVKITKEIADKIRSRYIPKVITMKQLGQEYGISDSAVEFIIKRHTWK